MANKEHRSVMLDSISVAIIEKYMTGHNISFSEAIRDLVMQSGDDTADSLNKLSVQATDLAYQVRQTGKCLTSFETKAEENITAVNDRLAGFETKFEARMEMFHNAMGSMITAIKGLQQKVNGGN